MSKYYSLSGTIHEDIRNKSSKVDTGSHTCGEKASWGEGRVVILHRTDGPAVEWTTGYVAYWENGLRHNLKGPAVIYPDEVQRISGVQNLYYILGKKISPEKYAEKVKEFKNNLVLMMIDEVKAIREIAKREAKRNEIHVSTKAKQDNN